MLYLQNVSHQASHILSAQELPVRTVQKFQILKRVPTISFVKIEIMFMTLFAEENEQT